jgi:hypothetical protein
MASKIMTIDTFETTIDLKDRVIVCTLPSSNNSHNVRNITLNKHEDDVTSDKTLKYTKSNMKTGHICTDCVTIFINVVARGGTVRWNRHITPDLCLATSWLHDLILSEFSDQTWSFIRHGKH